jgi:signal transduction histidine kinase
METDRIPATPHTGFAPAGRAAGEELNAEVASCLDNPVAQVVLEAVESYALILNEHRQMLAANAALYDALAREDPACFQGLRPGEIFGCVHVEEGPDGCGTSKACGRCGAVLTILAAQKSGQAAEGECLLSAHADGKWDAREFHVRATPLQIAGHPFLVLVLRDISALKRREVLEQVFLHDLLNTLQGLRGWTELLQMSPESPTAAAQKIANLSDHLTEEVMAQRLLLQAERGELNANRREIPLPDFFKELLPTILNHQCSAQRHLEIAPLPGGMTIRTDSRLLHRILLNMTINALEATEPGGRVRIQAERENGGHRFTVHNPGCIPESVASQIFLRSFSTKGKAGRGLGTYSMKLLGENILGGQVGFQSTPGDGTQFYLFLPDSA